MFERFTKDARAVVTEAQDLARERGALQVEAEHLLLAIAGGRSHAAAVLSEHGLDREGLDEALREETVRSLAAVGVTADALHFAPFTRSPKLGTSAKRVLERSLRIALARGEKQLDQRHLALAALEPARGTVPRALECAGVDRDDLISALSA
jgi:ATP-dependent Clp protease ATP-binding subunit ClpA